MGRRPKRFGAGLTFALAASALVVGCADSTAVIAPGSEAPAPISDPVVAFAANGLPGAEDSVVLPSTGQTARLRMVRSYAAASGRECREVQVTTGGGSYTRLLCGVGTGWREARPLMRDAVARP
jgi:hypothetical protein